MNQNTARRIHQRAPFFAAPPEIRAPWEPSPVPFFWIAPPETPCAPFVAAFRCRFSLAHTEKLNIYVSADERYELFWNGQRIGRGPTRGDGDNWFYESYELQAQAGQHVLTARVWSLKHLAPHAQMSVEHGFLLMCDESHREILGTGSARWETKILGGYRFERWPGEPSNIAPVGAKTQILGAEFDWDLFDWDGDGSDANGWSVARNGEGVSAPIPGKSWHAKRRLKASPLPPMVEVARQVGTARFVGDFGAPIRDGAGDCGAWSLFLSGKREIEIGARQKLRVLVDLNDYFCAYPEVQTSGGNGAQIEVLWAESLFQTPDGREKGDRNAVEGKFFRGAGARFWPDGGAHRRFQTLWWEGGRFLELRIETAEQPLLLHALVLHETRYPLENEAEFGASDARLQALSPALLRSLQMNAHETYMDCPYYEQLMYVGDLALQALAAFPVWRDARLGAQAIRLLDASRGRDGFTQSRYPSSDPQSIPPFSAAWVEALRNHCLWRGDRELLREMMPGVRATVEAFLAHRTNDGLIGPLPGWNFVDWVPNPAWQFGVPPGGISEASGVLGWQFVAMLRHVAQLERWSGETELEGRAQRLARELTARLLEAFWDERRAMLADDLAHQNFSQHSHTLALLGGQLPPEKRAIIARNLAQNKDLTRAAPFFQHYVWEALRENGALRQWGSLLDFWFQAHDLGVKCTLEDSDLRGTRSDCHGWTAHPLFHFHATILGVRPGSFGFQTVEIAPNLGELEWARGTVVHPLGEIRVELEKRGEAVNGEIELPEGVSGIFRGGATQKRLTARGKQKFCLAMPAS